MPLRPQSGPQFKPVITLLPNDMPERLDHAAIAAGYDSRAAFIRDALEHALRPYEKDARERRDRR